MKTFITFDKFDLGAFLAAMGFGLLVADAGIVVPVVSSFAAVTAVATAVLFVAHKIVRSLFSLYVNRNNK